MSSDHERLIELEKKLAFQEAETAELREALELHQKRISSLEDELRVIKDKMDSDNPVIDIKDERPPPHY